jgi:glutamyl-tRNA synthetase
MTGRLAPSPTGSLHIGNARTFLWAWLSARKSGGRVVLRVEDLEKPAGPGVLEEMLSDLWWMGFDWDEGPAWDGSVERTFRKTGKADVAETGPNGPYIQSLRRDFYVSSFETLRRRDLIYPCVCSREDILSSQSAPHDGEKGLRYPGTCRERFGSFEEAAAFLKGSRPPVWRFRARGGSVPFDDLLSGRHGIDVSSDCGDFVAFKSPGQPSYQVAVVLDDAAMSVTEVVRGDDLIPSTGRQILVHEALGTALPRYGHVPLVVGPDGKRLAKRHGDARISALRKQGVPAGRLMAGLARWSGLECPDPCAPRELIGAWDWGKADKRRVILTPELLASVSGK